MWLTDFFKFSYKLPQPCLGCTARQAHIEDLQNLLKSERESYASLQSILLAKAGLVAEVKSEDEAEMKPLRNLQTISQLRRQAERKEREEFPNATKEYWTKVQEQYDKAGKLPEVKSGG